MEKNWGDTPSATLTVVNSLIQWIQHIAPWIRVHFNIYKKAWHMGWGCISVN